MAVGKRSCERALLKVLAALQVPLDFWSDPVEEAQIGDAVAGATVALPSVVVAGIPAGATVHKVQPMFISWSLENTNVAANKLNGATVPTTSQVIQVRKRVGGTWTDAFIFADDQYGMAGSAIRHGPAFIGSINVAAEVNGNGTYEFRWLLSRADLDFLNLNDIQVGLRVWCSVQE